LKKKAEQQQKKIKDFEFAKELVTSKDDNFNKADRPKYEVYPGE